MKRTIPAAFNSALQKTALVGLLFFGLNNLPAIALPAGFKYRSVTTGNWNSLSTWERSADGNSWSAISDFNDIPNATAEDIIIRNNHIITLQNATIADQVTIDFGGTLEVMSGLTLPANAQQGLTVNGLLMIHNGGSLITNRNVVAGGGEFFLDAGGTLEIGAAEGILINQLGAQGNVGTIQVTGDRSFSSSANYIYAGNAAQVTGNGFPAAVNNLVINNPQGITLSQPVEVSANLQLIEGKLKPGAQSLTLGANASVTPAAVNKISFVEGAMAIKAATSKTLLFPIGKGMNYRPVSLNIVSTAGENTYTAEQYDQGFTVPGGTTIPEQVNKISEVRHFHISKTGNNAVTANLTLSYGTDDNVSDYAKLALVKYDASTGWQYLGGNASANGSGTITSGNFSTFSNFMLANQGGGSNTLPVELLSFTGKHAGTSVLLNWRTASETNSDRFVIERSTDGKSFVKIGDLKTGENSATEKRYAFTDKNPVNGIGFYRLKQVDLDGSFVYSGVVMVKSEKAYAAPSVYPNPATAQLTIKAPAGNISLVKIINMVGQEVLNQNFTGAGNATLNVASLPAGAYQVIIMAGNQQSAIKFVKTAN